MRVDSDIGCSVLGNLGYVLGSVEISDTNCFNSPISFILYFNVSILKRGVTMCLVKKTDPPPLALGLGQPLRAC